MSTRNITTTRQDLLAEARKCDAIATREFAQAEKLSLSPHTRGAAVRHNARAIEAEEEATRLRDQAERLARRRVTRHVTFHNIESECPDVAAGVDKGECPDDYLTEDELRLIDWMSRLSYPQRMKLEDIAIDCAQMYADGYSTGDIVRYVRRNYPVD